MNKNVTRLVGWATILQNFGVTALVVWVLAILLATQSLPSEQLHFEHRTPVVALSQNLGFVGMPTVLAQPHSAHSIAASGALASQAQWVPEGGSSDAPFAILKPADMR